MPTLIRHIVEYSVDHHILCKTPSEVRSILSQQITGRPVNDSSIISINGIPMMNEAVGLGFQHDRLLDVTCVEVYQKHSKAFDLEVYEDGRQPRSVSATWQNTIGEIKAFINDKYGIPVEAQCLRFHTNRDLKDDDKLRDVTAITPLSLVDLKNDRFTVLVKTLTGKNITVLAGVMYTVKMLKGRLQYREGIPSDQQRISFCGRVLEDEDVFGSCGITTGSILHLVADAQRL